VSRGEKSPEGTSQGLVDPEGRHQDDQDLGTRVTRFPGCCNVVSVRGELHRLSDADLLQAQDPDAFVELYDRYLLAG
jgi:hypothetical protein